MILPMLIPIATTYQSTSFILGIISANPSLEGEFYNNYMGVRCKKTTTIGEVELDFYKVDWESYRQRGVAEMDLFHFENFDKKGLVGFIQERIDQGNYMLFYHVDEYYLSYSEYYQVSHFIHDIYVYGYKEDVFCAMAYQEKKLSLLEVRATELIDGVFSEYMPVDDRSFCSFRPHHCIASKINLNKMLDDIHAYLYETSDGNEEVVLNLKIYDVLEDCVTKMYCNYNKNISADMDVRSFRMLWEHKKVIYEHMKKLVEFDVVDATVMEKAQSLINLSKDIFLLSIKYNLTYRSNTLLSISDLLRNLRLSEESFLKNVIFLARRNCVRYEKSSLNSLETKKLL